MEETVTISKEEYQKLILRSEKLNTVEGILSQAYACNDDGKLLNEGFDLLWVGESIASALNYF